MTNLIFGAGGRTGARRQNPAGKTELLPVSSSFREGTRAPAKAGLSTPKPSLLAICKVDPEQGLRRNQALFWQAQRSDLRLPGTGSELWYFFSRRELVPRVRKWVESPLGSPPSHEAFAQRFDRLSCSRENKNPLDKFLNLIIIRIASHSSSQKHLIITIYLRGFK